MLRYPVYALGAATAAAVLALMPLSQAQAQNKNVTIVLTDEREDVGRRVAGVHGVYALPPTEIRDRLLLRLLNEAVRALRERIVTDADLVDDAMVFGTGFAPFRGGPLTYARDRGVAEVVTRLCELTARHGPRFAPDAHWDHLLAAAAPIAAGGD